MKRARRLGVRFMFSGGGAPRALRVGASPTGPLRPGAEKAYAALLAGDLAVARDCGVPFDWAATGNEPDIGGAHLGSDVSRAGCVRVTRSWRRRSRNTVWTPGFVLGDDQGWARTYDYAQLEWESAKVRELASVVASHAYSGATPPLMERMRMARYPPGAFALDDGVVPGVPASVAGPIRLELPSAGRFRSPTPSTSADAEAWFMFRGVAPVTHGVPGAIIVRGTSGPHAIRPTKSFFVLRQFTSVARPGARRYETNVTGHGLLATSFRSGAIESVVVTSSSHDSRDVVLDLGGRPGIVRARATSERLSFDRLRPLAYPGSPITVSLPPLSVTTFELAARGGRREGRLGAHRSGEGRAGRHVS